LKWVASGLLNGFVEIYDSGFAKLQSIRAHYDWVSGLYFIDELETLVTCGEDHKTIVWSITTF